jgi:adenylate cyclase
MFWNGGMRANEAYPRAKAAAQRALALDETTADAWTALALAELDFYWNWEAAEGALKQALALNQSDAVAHELYGHRLLSAVQGRYDEAIAEMKRALELNPLSLGANHRLGMVLMHARQLDSAIEQLDKAVELGPNFIWPHLGLAYCYAAKGMYEDAISETQKTVQITGRSAFTLGQLAWAYGLAGNKEKAMDILHELEKIRKRNSVDPAAFAYLYLGLDDKDQGLYWLQKMYEERSPEMLYLRAAPSWDRLRTDPRFAELIKNVGLEPVAN